MTLHRRLVGLLLTLTTAATGWVAFGATPTAPGTGPTEWRALNDAIRLARPVFPLTGPTIFEDRPGPTHTAITKWALPPSVAGERQCPPGHPPAVTTRQRYPSAGARVSMFIRRSPVVATGRCFAQSRWRGAGRRCRQTLSESGGSARPGHTVPAWHGPGGVTQPPHLACHGDLRVGRTSAIHIVGNAARCG
jgi:hypothetical protein